MPHRSLAMKDQAYEKLLSVTDLTVQFATADGWVSVVENLSFSIGQGKSLGLVGRIQVRGRAGISLRYCSCCRDAMPGLLPGSIELGTGAARSEHACSQFHPRPRHRHDLPRADDEPEPSFHCAHESRGRACSREYKPSFCVAACNRDVAVG